MVPPALPPPLLRSTFPPFSRKWGRPGGGLSDCAVTGARVSLTIAFFAYPCESNSVKWISLSARPPRTDRRLSERFNRYLSSRCLLSVIIHFQRRVSSNAVFVYPGRSQIALFQRWENAICDRGHYIIGSILWAPEERWCRRFMIIRSLKKKMCVS